MDRSKEIETASRIEREKVFNEVIVAYGFHKDNNHYCITSACVEKYAVPLFKAGVEWADKHPKSLWISAKNKLPDDEELVITGCWCTDYFKYLQQGWYCRECNEWHDTDGDEICVTHWMPIIEPK